MSINTTLGPDLPLGPTLLSAPIQVAAWHTFSGQNLAPAPGYTGPAIQPLGAGWAIRDCKIRGFSVGIDTSKAKMEADGTGEPYIGNCHIYDCGIGINLENISDGIVENCWIANTIGHGGGEWVNQPYQVSTTTGLAGVRCGRNAGAWTLSKVHVWGNYCHGLLIWTSQTKVLGCRIEGGRVALITIGGWNVDIMDTEVWNVLQNLAEDGTPSPALAPALKLGTLNEPGQLGYDPGMSQQDFGVAQCSIELLASNMQPMFPQGVVLCDHENHNFVSVLGKNVANSGPIKFQGRLPEGGESVIKGTWTR